MNKTTIKSILSVAALTLAAGYSIGSAAETVSETVIHGSALHSQSVSYSKAELQTSDGRAVLERKIERAAEQVCGPQGLYEAGSLSRAAKNRDCFDQAVNDAMSQIGADQLATRD